MAKEYRILDLLNTTQITVSYSQYEVRTRSIGGTEATCFRP